MFLRLSSFPYAAELGRARLSVVCVKQTIIIFQCWETYVGQELYKLVIMDFIVVVAVTFGAEFPRR